MYTIIGQGIAGSLLAFQLIKAGHQVQIYDEITPFASSRVAAGLINPITGRKYVKSWMIDALIPVAKKVYTELEKELKIDFFKEITILRLLKDELAEEQWLLRENDPDYIPHLSNKDSTSFIEDFYKSDSHWISIKGYRVHFRTLLAALRKYFFLNGTVINEKFDFNSFDPVLRTYKGDHLGQVIFCEGSSIADNQIFDWIPFVWNKGEALLLKVPEFPDDIATKRKYFLTRWEEDLCWFGSSYDWDDHTLDPTEKFKKDALTEFEDHFNRKIKIVERMVSIRPSVQDRRPVLGQHPQYAGVFIFNGLGTKGASLAPFCTDMMYDHLVKGGELMKAVDVKRFWKAQD